MSADRKTLKFQMMMSPEEARILDDWMFANRVRSRAEAIRLLCAFAIQAGYSVTGIPAAVSPQPLDYNPDYYGTKKLYDRELLGDDEQ